MSNSIVVSRRRLEFDKKLKQIEKDESKLKALEQELLKLQYRVAAEIGPIVKEFCEIRFENLNRLQHHLSDSSLKKKDKRHIVHLMRELAYGLQNMGDSRADEFLNENSFLDNFQEETPDEVNSYKFKAPPLEEKVVEGKLEIKTLFRQLARRFHPDKEPLEHLKEEKTSLMKKITAAYENQDLYGLLKLEQEHLGPREFSEDKMELYSKHINDRLKELKNFEANLKKHGPLATIYKVLFSQDNSVTEANILNEISKIEEEVKKEKALQQIIWDSGTLKNFIFTR